MSKLLDRTKSMGRKSASGPGHTLSHKHHHPDSGETVDTLITRGDQWREIVKGVHSYFESVAKAEHHTATELRREATGLPVPFSAGAQFNQEEGGWQSALYALREHTRTIADYHEGFAKSIESHVLADLTRTKHTIKSHTEEIAADAGKESDLVKQERKASTTALGNHGSAIAKVGQHLTAPTAHDDPRITASIVDRQLHQQLEHENQLTRRTIHYQGLSETLEQRYTKEIQAACSTFTKAQEDLLSKSQHEWSLVGQLFSSIRPEGEWSSYRDLEGVYLDPETPLRDASNVQYPNQDHEASRIVWSGVLERKKRFAKSYVEQRVEITSAGFLHCFDLALDESDPKKALPALSLYLPQFALGPPSSATESKHKLHIIGRKSTKSSGEQTMKKLGLGKREIAYTFRAPTHAKMTELYEAMEPLTRDVITVDRTDAATHKNAVPEAVQYVGLAQPVGGSGRSYEDDGSSHLRASTASAGSVEHHTGAIATEPGSAQIQAAEVAHAHDDDEEEDDEEEDERGGSSDEEEFSEVPTTPAGAATTGKEHQLHAVEPSIAGPSTGESLPGYASNGVAAPAEKKVLFAADPPTGGAAAGSSSAGAAGSVLSQFPAHSGAGANPNPTHGAPGASSA